MIKQDLHQRHARRILIQNELAADVPLALKVEHKSPDPPVSVREDPIEMSAASMLLVGSRKEVGIVGCRLDFTCQNWPKVLDEHPDDLRRVRRQVGVDLLSVLDELRRYP